MDWWLILVVILGLTGVIVILYFEGFFSKLRRKNSSRNRQVESTKELQEFDRILYKATFVAMARAEEVMNIIKDDAIPGLSDKLAKIGSGEDLVSAKEAIEDFLCLKTFGQKEKAQTVQQMYARNQAQLKQIDDALCAIQTLKVTNSVHSNENPPS
ncbi:MAG TPA: hypothetical protein VFM68_03410 [Candidatus Saccharimonadales bacterium]|nr:hypothetical protein [Candidatus Saccharimonadales bacterium]